MKMLIAVPCMDQVPAMFAQSLAMLRKVDEKAIGRMKREIAYYDKHHAEG